MTRLPNALLGAALAIVVSAPVAAQQTAPTGPSEAARPSDSTANRPSESGAQTNLPTGAAAGTGHAQGAAQPPIADAGSMKAKTHTKTTAKKSGKRTKHVRTQKTKRSVGKSAARAAEGTAGYDQVTR